MNYSLLTDVANWNTKNQSPNGIRPPQPATTANSGLRNQEGTIWSLHSLRQPYASEYLVTPYGGLETKLGTNLGTNLGTRK